MELFVAKISKTALNLQRPNVLVLRLMVLNPTNEQICGLCSGQGQDQEDPKNAIEMMEKYCEAK